MCPCTVCPAPQSLKLLPPSLEPGTVARFLRACPGLAKPSIGEILGERDTFYEQVREAYMQTFDFTGMAVASGQRCAAACCAAAGGSMGCCTAAGRAQRRVAVAVAGGRLQRQWQWRAMGSGWSGRGAGRSRSWRLAVRTKARAAGSGRGSCCAHGSDRSAAGHSGGCRCHLAR